MWGTSDDPRSVRNGPRSFTQFPDEDKFNGVRWRENRVATSTFQLCSAPPSLLQRPPPHTLGFLVCLWHHWLLTTSLTLLYTTGHNWLVIESLPRDPHEQQLPDGFSSVVYPFSACEHHGTTLSLSKTDILCFGACVSFSFSFSWYTTSGATTSFNVLGGMEGGNRVPSNAS